MVVFELAKIGVNFCYISVQKNAGLFCLTLKGRHFLPNINDWEGAQSAPPPIFLPNECSDKKKTEHNI